MGQKRILSPDTPVRSFPTPNVGDLAIIQDVDSRLPGYKPLEYGTPHPDQTRFPGAKLVYQEPLDNSDSFVRRIYASDRANQDAYNYAVKYSSGSPQHPVYVRTYVLPRADYTPLPDGSPDPEFKDASLVEEEMAPVDGELNSLYVRVTRVFETLPGPILTSFETSETGQKITVTTQRKSSAGYTLPQATATSSPSAQAEDTGVVTEQIRTVPSVFARAQFSAERPDPLPSKFRAAVPDVETSSIIAGTAEQPILAVPQDLSASETQETQFLKRISRRLRPDPDYPVSFVETTRTNTGQVATVTSVLQDFLQQADSGPLVESSEVTDLGDGRSIKVTTEVDQIFEQPSFTRAKEDLTPQKFRAAVSETVEERTVAGTASMPPTLAASEFAKTEEQVTVDRKRVRTQERDISTTSSLSEQVVTPEGQLATRTLTLSDQSQTVTPSATLIQGEVEQLGDGRTVKTEIEVGEVFNERRVAKEKPDLVPQEFRGAVPTEIVESVSAGTSVTMPDLGPGELARSSQRVTAHKIRETVTTRPSASFPVTLTPSDTLIDNDGVRVTRIKTLAEGSQSLTPSATVSGSVENIGDGLTVKTEDTRAEVFSGAAFTQAKEDLTPQKFRASVAEQVEESTVAGIASMPASLTPGELEKSEQQVTKFTKRTRVRRREISVARQLEESVITGEGQLATRRLTLVNGPQFLEPSATIIQGDIEELGDGRTVKTEIEVGEVFDEKRVTKEKPDLVPPEFRGAVPTEVTETVAAGTSVSMPELGPGELARSAQRINAHRVRQSVTTRPSTSLPVTLNPSDTLLDNDGVVVTRVKTLAAGPQSFTPTATVSGTVENIGDGLTVRTIDTKAEIFSGAAFTKSKEDLTPAKFRSLAPEEVEESTGTGIASMPGTLASDEFEKSEQQVNKFTKRTRIRRRQIVGDKELEEAVITNEGQLATRRLTLAEGPQVITPSATLVQGEVEELGDGRTIKTEIEVGEVFDEQRLSLERPDLVPAEFRGAVPAQTTESVFSGTEVVMPTLSPGDLARSSQRVTAHKIRETVTTRPTTNLPVTLTPTDTLIDNDGIRVTRVKTLAQGAQTIAPSATVSGTIQTLGDGLTVKTEDIKSEVFTGATFTKAKEDLTPQKFRAAVAEQVEESTTVGTAAMPASLGSDEFEKSEQQVTKFTKRTRVRRRQISEQEELEEKVITNEGQLATRRLTLVDGPQTLEPSATVVQGEIEELGDGRTVKTEIEVDQVFDERRVAKEKPDLVPQEFRGAVPTETTESVSAGATVTMPNLAPGELARSAQRISAHKVRETVTTRPSTSLPVTLTPSDILVDNEGVTVTRVKTLATGAQTLTPSATVSGSVENIGDGLTVKTQDTKSEVFASPAFTRVKEDLTPQKFRASISEEVLESTVAGTASMPAYLAADEFEKSEQQVTKFTKRSRTRKRSVATADDLVEQVLTNDGQVAERRLSLRDTQQTLTPSATLVSGEVEQLGDSRTVKTEVRVPQVFENKSLGLEKPDVTPEKFRAAIPSTSVERTVEGQVVGPLVLTGDEISKSEQQVTQFTKRVRTVERDPAGEATLSQGQEFTRSLGGGVANVIERYGSEQYADTAPGFGTISYEKQELGDGKFVSRHVTLSTTPVLTGQIYDEQLDIVVPFTTATVPAINSSIGTDRVSVNPEDHLHSTARSVDILAYRQKVLAEHYQIAAYINVELPDTLLSVEAVRVFSSSSGSATGGGTSWSVEASGTSSNTIDMRWRIRNGYTGPVPATRHIFFLDKAGTTLQAILSKCQAEAFPKLFPEPVTITSVSGSVTRRVSASFSFDVSSSNTSSSQGESFGNTLSSTITTIPPTLHAGIAITNADTTFLPNNPTPPTNSSSSPVTTPAPAPAFTGAYTPTSIPATSPPIFPHGNYLISMDTESFRYGLVRVTALVAHITQDYVTGATT